MYGFAIIFVTFVHAFSETYEYSPLYLQFCFGRIPKFSGNRVGTFVDACRVNHGLLLEELTCPSICSPDEKFFRSRATGVIRWLALSDLGKAKHPHKTVERTSAQIGTHVYKCRQCKGSLVLLCLRQGSSSRNADFYGVVMPFAHETIMECKL